MRNFGNFRRLFWTSNFHINLFLHLIISLLFWIFWTPNSHFRIRSRQPLKKNNPPKTTSFLGNAYDLLLIFLIQWSWVILIFDRICLWFCLFIYFSWCRFHCWIVVTIGGFCLIRLLICWVGLSWSRDGESIRMCICQKGKKILYLFF